MAWTWESDWAPVRRCAGLGWTGPGHSLALLVQQVEEAGGLLADELDAAHVVRVVDVVPGDALPLVLLLQRAAHTGRQRTQAALFVCSAGGGAQGPRWPGECRTLSCTPCSDTLVIYLESAKDWFQDPSSDTKVLECSSPFY